MEHKVFVLKQNTPEIRERIRQAGIDVCFCADFVDADWLDYHTAVANAVHGNGYPYEGMTKEETRAMFLNEVQNPVYCKDVDEFIKLIKEFEDGNNAK